MKRLIVFLPFALLAACSSVSMNNHAAQGNISKIEEALNKGADPNMTDGLGQTPLMQAAYMGQTQTVEFLLSKGADINFKTRAGTALSHAAFQGHESLVRLLLDRGAKADGTAADAADAGGFQPVARIIRGRITAQQAVKPVEVPKAAAQPRPNDYALVIGISRYDQGAVGSAMAEKDAEAVKKHLLTLGFPEDNVALLMGRRANRGNIVARSEEWLAQKASTDSTVVFYFSGKSEKGLLLPWDADPAYLNSTAYPVKNLLSALNKLPAKQVLAVFEAPMDAESEGKVTVLSAGAPAMYSYDLGHGVFTYHFLTALTEGKRAVKDVYQALKPAVEAEANKRRTPQSPSMTGPEASL